MFLAVAAREDKKIHLQGKDVRISIVLCVFTAKISVVERDIIFCQPYRLLFNVCKPRVARWTSQLHPWTHTT